MWQGSGRKFQGEREPARCGWLVRATAMTVSERALKT